MSAHTEERRGSQRGSAETPQLDSYKSAGVHTHPTRAAGEKAASPRWRLGGHSENRGDVFLRSAGSRPHPLLLLSPCVLAPERNSGTRGHQSWPAPHLGCPRSSPQQVRPTLALPAHPTEGHPRQRSRSHPARVCATLHRGMRTPALRQNGQLLSPQFLGGFFL